MQRVLRLEQQRGADRSGTMTPAARQRRMRELLLKCGVAEDELETVNASLLAISASERQAWLAARHEGAPGF
jgi:hypothetical protein